MDVKTTTWVLAGMMLWAGVAAAESPTFADVQPILRANCVECHQPAGSDLMGMVAPMPLRTFEETRPWAKAIARAVQSGTMPPWHAAPEFHGVFENERTLTESEIETIVRWVDGGAQRGPTTDEEPQLESAGGWTIGEPDLVVPFEEPYWVADSVEDLYANIYVEITDEMMPEDRWIRAMQCKPGSEAVHHVVVYTDDYRESLGFPMGMLGGAGPGTDATVFPDGFGRFLGRGTGLTFNMHYHKEPGPGTGVWDTSAIAFVFQDEPVRHEANWGAVGTMSFVIPPYASDHEVTAEHTFQRETILLALFPHTHLRGKASKYTAYYADGTEEVLLHVPEYDFNWQTNYLFKEPKRIPASTRIKVQMWYDNSEERAKVAGIDPSRRVYWGEPTTSEMMYGWMDYADAAPLKE